MGLFDSGTAATVTRTAGRASSTSSTGSSGAATVSTQASRGTQYQWNPTTKTWSVVPGTGSGSTTKPPTTTTPKPSTPSVDTTPPTNTPTQPDIDPTLVFDELRALFPWLDQIGVDPKWFQQVAVDTFGNPDAALVKFRQLPQYKQRFPGLWRQDGSLRMNESEYLRTEDQYRTILRQAGFDESLYKNPSDLAPFFESEQAPDELNQRVEVYQRVRDASQPVRDAFYVYAGMDVSVDDLFEATVDENMAARLSGEYVQRISSQSFNYETFINRVTEVAGRRAADLVSKNGDIITVQHDPELTRTVMDLLYTSGVQGAQPLALDELLAAYEEAVLGATATAAGLSIPTKERIAALREAGIQRAQAQRAYLEFARSGGSLSGGAQRAGLGAIDQNRFERGVFLGDGSATQALQTGAAYEQAAGVGGGQFRFDQNRYGRLYQRGFGD